MGFSRQESQSGLPRGRLGDLPDPGIEPWPLMSPALAWLCHWFFTTSTTWEAYSDHAAAAAAKSLKSVLIASEWQDRKEAQVSMMPKPVFLVTFFSLSPVI